MAPRNNTYRHALFLAGVTVLLAGCAAPSRRLSGRHLDLYAHLDPTLCEELLAHADRYVEAISQLLEKPVPHAPLQVLAFRSQLELGPYLLQHCPKHFDSRAACYQTREGYVVAVSRYTDHQKTLRDLRHELTHYVLASHFYDLPPWIDEGLAQFVEAGEPFGQINRPRLSSLVRQLRRKKPLLEKLVAKAPGKKLTRSEYAQAWGLAFFLMKDERFGPQRLRAYLKRVRAGEETSAFIDCLGAHPQAIEQDWRRFILSVEPDDPPP